MPSLRSVAGDLAAVDVAGQLDRGHHGRALVRVAVEVEPERERAGARGAGEQVVARPDVLEPLLLDHPSATSRPRNSETAGVNGLAPLAWLFAVRPQSK